MGVMNNGVEWSGAEWIGARVEWSGVECGVEWSGSEVFSHPSARSRREPATRPPACARACCPGPLFHSTSMSSLYSTLLYSTQLNSTYSALLYSTLLYYFSPLCSTPLDSTLLTSLSSTLLHSTGVRVETRWRGPCRTRMCA